MRVRPVLFALLIAGLAGGAWHFFRSGDAKQAAAGPRRPPVAVITEEATKGAFPVRRRTIGVVETPASVVVRSRIASQIVTQHVRDGQMVKEGDLLFTLDDREARAAVARDEAAVARDEALLARANADQERARQLAARSAASQSQVDLAVANARSAAAALAGSKAALDASRLQLDYTRIRAPMSGRLGSVRVAPGNLVGAGDLSGQGLVTITQIQPVRVTFTLPERDLPALREAFRRAPPVVRVTAPNSDLALGESRIDFIDNAVDTSSGTILARATFANEDLRLWPGMFVDVTLDLDQRPDTVSVPTIAVQQGQDSPFVYVVGKDDVVSARPVTVFAALDGRTGLVSGVSAGEQVVVEGQQRIGPGVKVAPTLRPATSAGDGLARNPGPPSKTRGPDPT